MNKLIAGISAGWEILRPCTIATAVVIILMVWRQMLMIIYLTKITLKARPCLVSLMFIIAREVATQSEIMTTWILCLQSNIMTEVTQCIVMELYWFFESYAVGTDIATLNRRPLSPSLPPHHRKSSLVTWPHRKRFFVSYKEKKRKIIGSRRKQL